MKKFFVISLIIFLILFTALIKNSTKRIDDQIFTKKENIRDLKKDFENIKLENEYLSSADKLLEFKNFYFFDKLIIKDIREIKVLNNSLGKIEIKKFNLINE